jgi:hypothetical protein
MFSLDPVKIFHELFAIYADADKTTKLKSLIREMLLREISSNLDLLSEVKNLSKRKNDRLENEEKIKLLQYLKFDFFEFSKMSGIPLFDIVRGDFIVDSDSNTKYKSRLKHLKSNAELVEKAYDRMLMQYIYAKENISKRSDSIEYAIQLGLLAKTLLSNSSKIKE